MPTNASNDLLREYLRDLDRRQPCKKRYLHACPFGFRHEGILSAGLSNRENIGRRFEICYARKQGDQSVPTCFFHGKPSRSQLSCEALADMFAYIASLDIAPFDDEAFIDFACASTIAFNHRAAQARVERPNDLEKSRLAYERAFPPYVDLPAYHRTVPEVESPVMLTPTTFAGLLSVPLPRKTGLLPPCDHRVKVSVALYQINNFQASLLDCVGIKRGEIVEFTLRQTGIFYELGIQETDRHLAQIIEQLIPRALLGGGAPLPALLAYGQQLEHGKEVLLDAHMSTSKSGPAASTSKSALAATMSTFSAPLTASASAPMLASVASSPSSMSAIPPGSRGPADGLTCTSFTVRKNHRRDCASDQSPISMARRGARLSTPPAATAALVKVANIKGTTTDDLQHASSVKSEKSKRVVAQSEDIIEIADDIVNKSARFWQQYLKAGSSSRCLRAEGMESNPINLMDVGSELKYRKEDAP